MNKIIAVDFDGTLCENCYPDIGRPNTKLIDYLKWERYQGNYVILWTCRCGDELQAAVDWCKQQGFIFDAVNENVKAAIEKFGGDSRKVFADEYIDDKASVEWDIPYTPEPEEEEWSIYALKMENDKLKLKLANMTYQAAYLAGRAGVSLDKIRKSEECKTTEKQP